MAKKIGVAICGFGRAGQIHFNGIRSNRLCSLKYVVDRTDLESVKDLIQSKLDDFMMDEVKLVGLESFEEVSHQNNRDKKPALRKLYALPHVTLCAN